MRNQVLFIALFACISGSAVAQTTPPPPAFTGNIVSASSNSGPRGVITGKPYSAEQVTERVQTLADGTHITQASQKTLIYRDSEGRTRTEHVFTPAPGTTASGTSLVQINDPVAGVRYTLNPGNHTAQRITYAPGNPLRMQPTPAGSLGAIAGGLTAAGKVTSNTVPPSAAINSTPRPEMKHESLGTQSIDGVTVTGNRHTITYPEGSMGNDRPVTVVTETWTSPDLRIVVLSKTSDPRMGDSTTKLENLSQTEPDPALFQIPADYTVTEISK